MKLISFALFGTLVILSMARPQSGGGGYGDLTDEQQSGSGGGGSGVIPNPLSGLGSGVFQANQVYQEAAVLVNQGTHKQKNKSTSKSQTKHFT